MLKDLIKVANRLDALGLQKEADVLDQVIKKMAWPWDEEPMKITKDVKIGDEEKELAYYASAKEPYQYQVHWEDKRTGHQSRIYCAPGHQDNVLYTPRSLEHWNKDVESLMSGKKPSSDW